MPLIALRNTAGFYFRPVSGLMSGIIPNLRLPVPLHSGILRIVNSITVAGAVLALPEFNQNAPVSRLTFKEELEDT
jgi:hypothetical protein